MDEFDEVFGVFEYEDCDICGRGLEGHMVGVDPLGNEHAVCIDHAY